MSKGLTACNCGKLVADVNKCQRLHRDGIKLTTRDGVRKFYRTPSKMFRCPYLRCGYASKDSCNFQKHVYRCKFPTPTPVTDDHYPTPGPSSAPAEDSGPEGADWINTFLDDVSATANMAIDDGAGEVSDLDHDINIPSQSTLDVNDNNDDDNDNDDNDDDNDNDDHQDNHPEDHHNEDRFCYRDNDENEDDGGDDHDERHGSEYQHDDDGSGSFFEDEDDLVGTPKAEWSEDMVQTVEMQQLGICVNTAAKVIVCLACSSVIKPSDLSRHLIRVHKPISTTSSFCDQLVETYGLHEDPLSSRPGTIITAIYGLDLVAGYFTCDTCGYGCREERTIKQHVARSQSCRTYRCRYAQTFQPSSGRMYFGVELSPVVDEPEDPLDPLHYFKTRFTEPLFSDIAITCPDSACDTNHFLTLEPWLDLVKGKTGRELNDLVRVREPELRKEVRVCVDRYAQAATKDLKDVDHEARVTIGDYLGIGVSASKLKDLQVEKTRNAYCKVGADLVTFCLLVIDGKITEFKQMQITHEMSSAGKRFLGSLERISTRDQDEALQDFLFSLFSHKRRGTANKFTFPVYNFLIIYSFTEYGNLRPCNLFTPFFSSVIFFGRETILKHILAHAKRDDTGFFETYEQYKHLLMLRSDYPLGVIYSAKNLAKKVARDQHRDDKVDLVGPEMDTAILGRITIKLASIGELYHKVLKEATELQENLFGGIGFGDEEWFSFEVPDRFTDLVNSDRPGYCFGDEEGNNFKRYQDCGLNVLLHHPYFKDRYGCMVADGQFIPNAVACHDFLRQSSEVDSMIAVLFHTGLGSPGRGTESTSQFLRNHPQGNIRNIKIVEGRLCVVGGYNKSSSMTGNLKKICRFLPKSLYHLVLVQWFIVRPTQLYLASILGLKSAIEELQFRLFPGIYGLFTSEELSRCLKRDTERYLGQRIGIADYRDIQTAFADEHEDPDALPMYTPDAVEDLQRGHGTSTKRANYGLRPDELRDVAKTARKAYLRCSIWWHHITGIEPLESPPAHHQTDTGQPNNIETPSSTLSRDPQLNELVQKIRAESKQEAKELKEFVQSCFNDAVGASLAYQTRGNATASGGLEREHFIPHPSLIVMLRKFLDDPKATFKNAAQAEALEVSLAGDRHLLLVGPTAMGKSLVYMLPAAQRKYGITVVLLPLSALHPEFERRCRDLGISNSRWLPGINDQPKTRIVYVSPEHAQTSHFTNYLMSISHKRELVQIVIDEVHLIKQHDRFRFCFSALRPLVSSGVQIVMMTATCPLPLRSEILSCIGITTGSCHIVHSPTDRPEIAYNVVLRDSIGLAKDALVELWERSVDMKKNDASFRGLVYCRSKTLVNEVATALGCKPFHADLSEEENAKTFKDWVDGRTKVIVATSLLGCGIDVEGVGLVLHLGTPWSALDFAQESGRAGRGGRSSTSVVFASDNEWEPEGEDIYGAKTMRDWVLQKSACRRIALSSFLDGGHTTCVTLPGGALCDICRRESTQEHPRQLVKFTAPAIPDGDVPPPRKPLHVPPSSSTYELERSRHKERERSPTLDPEPSTTQDPPVASGSTAHTASTRKREREGEPMKSNKRPKVGNSNGSGKVRRTNNPHLAGIANRAAKAIQQRRKDKPKARSSVEKDANRWGTELRREISAQMVGDVRADLIANASDTHCSVCRAIGGYDDWREHASGKDCPMAPLDDALTDGWTLFKDSMKLPKGVVCWNCLLPTNVKQNLPGADYHPAHECKHKHFIRPVLFTFFTHATAGLKAFVKENLEVHPWEEGMEEYQEWLRASLKDDAPNPIKLYWWILKFWDRVPE